MHRKMNWSAGTVVVSGALAFVSGGAGANTIITNAPPSGTGQNALRNDYPGTVGFVFTVGSSPLSVTSLGVYDAFNNPNASGTSGANEVENTTPGDGLQTSHVVGLYLGSANASTLIAKATVPLGASGLAGDNFVAYAPTLQNAAGNTISSVALNAGAKYTLLAGFDAGAGKDGFIDNDKGTRAKDPAIASFYAAYGAGSSSALPGNNGVNDVTSAASQSYFGPNAAFTVVPEPAAAGALGFGAFGLLARRRR